MKAIVFVFIALLTAAGSDGVGSRAPQCGAVTVQAAIGRYSAHAKHGDAHAVAAVYLASGILGHAGAEPIIGPAAIEHFLSGFSQYHILRYRMTASSITAIGGGARADGTFEQHVRTPSGKVIDARGKFTSDWICDSAMHWRLARLETS